MSDAKFGQSEFVIPAPDLLAAKRFYERVFGWAVESPVGTRAHFQSKDLVGTFFSGAPPKKDGAVVHLQVSDVKKCCELVRSHGGKVVPAPTANGHWGNEYAAWFQDPNGNLVRLERAMAPKQKKT